MAMYDGRQGYFGTATRLARRHDIGLRNAAGPGGCVGLRMASQGIDLKVRSRRRDTADRVAGLGFNLRCTKRYSA